ncbi:MAG: hypothetical protein MJ119_01305 [Lachnospiraceae bacterium]|nr:hypothetical protein [Lachnospiraceae bacterium]
MAETPEEKAAKAERARIKSERKKLADEQKKQKKEVKKRAKELALEEAKLDDDEGSGGGFSVFIVALLLVIIWLAIFCLLVKLDIGGLGSKVMAPLIKDIPVVKMILPKDSITETEDIESYYGYSSLAEAVEQIRIMEDQLEELTKDKEVNQEQLATLKAEVERLKTFEDNQVEFQRIKTEFYEEVIYSEKGPGAEAFMEYYESIDPDTAEYIYRQLLSEKVVDDEIKEYAQAYAEMKPKQAAGIFEAMTDNLNLAAKILGEMSTEDRGKILGVMDPDVAAKITKIMEP